MFASAHKPRVELVVLRETLRVAISVELFIEMAAVADSLSTAAVPKGKGCAGDFERFSALRDFREGVLFLSQRSCWCFHWVCPLLLLLSRPWAVLRFLRRTTVAMSNPPRLVCLFFENPTQKSSHALFMIRKREDIFSRAAHSSTSVQTIILL